MIEKLAWGQAAALTASLAVLSVAFAQTAATDKVKEQFDEIRALDLSGTKEDSQKAASILKRLKGAKLDFNQHDDWVRYSRDTAIRLSDLDWLKELS